MPLSRLALTVALASQLALIVGLAWWCGLAAGAALGAPLIVSLLLLLRARPYTAGWSTMLVVFYVALLLAEGVAVPARRTVSEILAALAALDFTALVLFVRLTAREASATRTEPSAGAGR